MQPLSNSILLLYRKSQKEKKKKYKIQVAAEDQEPGLWYGLIGACTQCLGPQLVALFLGGSENL